MTPALETLSTKYRPTTWSEVLGQENNNIILKGMVSEGSYKVINSIIMAGTSGGGKTTSARIFAKAVNCLSKDKPCGECKHCKLFEQGIYPDFMEVDGTTYSGVNEIEVLKQIASMSPSIKDGTRIVLLDEAHALSSKAWDILLKPLEDARNRTIWIFATTQLHSIRPAIVGRSTVFKISPLSQSQVKQELQRICDLEGIKVHNKLLSDISRVFRGRMRDAIAELDKYYKAFGKDLSRVEIDVVTREDSLLRVFLEAIKNDVVSANVDLDRLTIQPSEIQTSVVNILTAGFLIKEDVDLFDFGTDDRLLTEFVNCFNIKDFHKLVHASISYDLNSMDRLKLFLLILVEYAKDKKEISVIDAVIEANNVNKTSVVRRGLKLAHVAPKTKKVSDNATVKDKPRIIKQKRVVSGVLNKKKILKPKPEPKGNQLLDLGFQIIK